MTNSHTIVNHAVGFVETPDFSHVIATHSTEINFASEVAHHRAIGSPVVIMEFSAPEKNFFSGIPNTPITKELVLDFYTEWQELGEKKALEWLADQVTEIAGISHPVRARAGGFIRTTEKQCRYFQKPYYNYFQELIEQHIAVKNILPENIQWIFAIDGIHALGNIAIALDSQADPELPKESSVQVIKHRIRQLKGQEPIEGTKTFWERTPLSIAIASHFNNGLVGHCSSLPEASKLIIDQRSGKDLGIINHQAFEVFRELLGLDDNLVATGAKRILIDVRHMSPASRQAYYRQVIYAFNETSADDQKIPIIATQVGFSGIDTLDEMAHNASQGKEKDSFRSKGFWAAGYNLSDEDVIAIFRSNGLIGLANDRRILGEDGSSLLTSISFKPLMRRRGLALMKKTIEQLVRIPFDYYLPNQLKIWDMISIHPTVSLFGFSNSLAISWQSLEEEVTIILEQLKNEEPLWFGSYRAEQLAKKICSGNLQDFVQRNQLL